MTNPPDVHTVGELRRSGHAAKQLRREIRDNLLAKIAAGENPWPGMHGFGRTVLPQLERALIAGHDVVLLGERGQGKTRLLRSLVGLLDEWTPAIAGSELGEHPYEPITPESKRRAASEGDELPICWRHRSERYSEKLATPDTSVADLIGDVDPMKVAEGRQLGDPETIHYGLIPRSHRGIVAINELPDLAERIQVAMLNVMEERDIQIRGYVLRLPLDVLVVAGDDPGDNALVNAAGTGVRRGAQLEGRGSAALVWQSALSPSAAGWGKAAPLPCLRMAVLGGWRRACPLVGVFPRRGRKKPLPRCGWGGRQGLSGALALERTS